MDLTHSTMRPEEWTIKERMLGDACNVAMTGIRPAGVHSLCRSRKHPEGPYKDKFCRYSRYALIHIASLPLIVQFRSWGNGVGGVVTGPASQEDVERNFKIGRCSSMVLKLLELRSNVVERGMRRRFKILPMCLQVPVSVNLWRCGRTISRFGGRELRSGMGYASNRVLRDVICVKASRNWPGGGQSTERRYHTKDVSLGSNGDVHGI